MVRDLRKRCPWDRAQTRETLRPYLVEEVLELDHALAQDDTGAIREELSDVLLHLAFQLAIAEERGDFGASDLADDLEAKMRRRHPHLFDLGAAEPWEQLKRRERKAAGHGRAGRGPGRGTLDGLPPTLPDLLRAYRLQERAAAVGFDWPDVAGPLDKVREELEETRHELERAAGSPPATDAERARLTDEIGDLFFAAVNLARKAGVQPTVALGRANRKFQRRFEAVERLAAARGIDLAAAGLDALDALWDEVKAAEPGAEPGNASGI